MEAKWVYTRFGEERTKHHLGCCEGAANVRYAAKKLGGE